MALDFSLLNYPRFAKLVSPLCQTYFTPTNDDKMPPQTSIVQLSALRIKSSGSPCGPLLCHLFVLVVFLLCVVDPFLEVFELSVVVFQELRIMSVMRIKYIRGMTERTFSSAFWSSSDSSSPFC